MMLIDKDAKDVDNLQCEVDWPKQSPLHPHVENKVGVPENRHHNHHHIVTIINMILIMILPIEYGNNQRQFKLLASRSHNSQKLCCLGQA